MKDAKTISVAEVERAEAPGAAEREVLGLVIAWCADQADRVGEVASFPAPGPPQILGRGDGDESGEPRVCFFRERPGQLGSTPALSGPALSRRQLSIQPRSGGLLVERLGRAPLSVNGVVVDRATVHEGDTLTLREQLVLICVRRKPIPAAADDALVPGDWPFGDVDALGIQGEAPATWRLRRELAFAAAAGKHVLIHGATGTGKELAARAIHRLSSRRASPFVARNAATLPPALIDAELFGNAKNYPNQPLPERPGLIGQAAGGTLFLDELAELPPEMQAHLLRVLDAGGEYQRLGDATARRSEFVLVGATNRPLDSLKHDLLARFALRIETPTLAARREDIPLLLRGLLVRLAGENAKAARFVGRGPDDRLQPRLDPDLVAELMRRDCPGNVREIESLLWRAMAASPGDTVLLPADLRTPSTQEPTEAQVRAALAREKGNVRRAARALGLSSRYGLYRLMKKHGIAIDLSDEPEES